MTQRTCPHCGAKLNSDDRASALAKLGSQRACTSCGKPLAPLETTLPEFEPEADLALAAFGRDDMGSPESTFDDPFSDAEDWFESHTLPDLPPLEDEDALQPALPPRNPPTSGSGPRPLPPTRDGSGEFELDFSQPGRELSGLQQKDLSLLGTYRVRESRGDARTDAVFRDGEVAASCARPNARRPKPLGQDEKPPKPAPTAKAANDFDPFSDIPAPIYGQPSPAPVDDPFASLDAPPPTAAPEVEDDPFADPFALDPFESAPPPPPSAAQGKRAAPAAEDIFEGSAMPPPAAAEPETFFIEEASVGTGLAGRVTGADSLELEDLPLKDGAEQAAASRQRRNRGPAEARTRQNKKTRGRKRRWGRSLLAAGALAFVAAGASLYFTPYGPFGLEYLFPAPARPASVLASGKPAPRRVVRSDTAAGYRVEIDALEKQIRANPADAQEKRELLGLYLEYATRFPSELDRDPSLDARVRELSRELGDAQSPRVKALALIRAGNAEEAKVALDHALAMAAEDPDLLCLHGDLALKQNDLAAARQYYERALELDPEMVRGQYFVGLVAEKEGKSAEARQRYEAALAAEPNHHPSRIGRARLALAAGQVDVAEADAKVIMSSAAEETTQQARHEALRLMASVAGRKQDGDAVVDYLIKAVALEPAHEETVLELAGLLVTRERTAEAEAALVACMEGGCQGVSVYEALARIRAERDPAEASRLADEAVEKHPDDPAANFLRADVARQRGLVQTARDLFAQMADRWPDHIDVYGKWADLEVSERNLNKAEQVLERGLGRAPKSTYLLERLAVVHESAGQLVKASEDFRRILELQPKNTTARLHYAKTLDELGYAQQAVEQFKQLAAQGYGDTEMTLAYARALARSGDPRAGIAELERLIRNDPHNVEAHTSLGRLYVEMGSLKSAESQLDTAIRLRPGYVPALVVMGQLEEARNRWATAAKHYQRAVELDPASRQARLHLAGAYSKLGDAESRKRAVDQLDAVISQANRVGDPLDASVYVLRAELRLAVGDYREALADAQKALSMQPSRVDALCAKGESLYKLKRPEDARGIFTEVLQRESNEPRAHYYLGQMALARGDRSTAERHLSSVVKALGSAAKDGSKPPFADAHKTLGFLLRERGLSAQARREFELYLEAAGPDARDREEVERMLARLR